MGRFDQSLILRGRSKVGAELDSFARRLDLERLDGRCTNGLGNAVRKALVDSGEHGQLSCFNLIRLGTPKVTSNVLDESLLGIIVEHLGVKCTRLLKVN